MKPIVVIGLGNPLMSDEGIGIHLLQALSADAGRHPDADFVDAGTAGFKALHAIAGRRKAVFIDCAMMGEAPGTIRRFSPDEVRSRKALPRFSLHEGDLLDTLEISRKLGECPADVVIFGIEPVSMAPGQELSDLLRSRLGEYRATIERDL